MKRFNTLERNQIQDKKIVIYCKNKKIKET